MNVANKRLLLSRFTGYMGELKFFIPLSLLLSALAAVLNALPPLLVWLSVRDLLASGGAGAGAIISCAWLALICAVSALIVYFTALLFAHAAAFKVETELQKQGMERIMRKPLGFFDKYASGRVRKVVNDGAAETHTFLAHQVPDIAGTVLSPILLLCLLFAVEWRMGIATLLPLLFGIFSMKFMMSIDGEKFRLDYLNSLEEMSSEAVEYVRGIPVVKAFGRTVESFNRFYGSIMRYRDMVSLYTMLWRKPMTFYTVSMRAAPFLLIPVAVWLVGSGGGAGVIANFVFL
jgi:ATP-binding cassette subfamily B protein IrtA